MTGVHLQNRWCLLHVWLDGARKFDAVTPTLSLLETNFLQQILVTTISPCWLSAPTRIPVTVMVVTVMAAVTMLVIWGGVFPRMLVFALLVMTRTVFYTKNETNMSQTCSKHRCTRTALDVMQCCWVSSSSHLAEPEYFHLHGALQRCCR